MIAGPEPIRARHRSIRVRMRRTTIVLIVLSIVLVVILCVLAIQNWRTSEENGLTSRTMRVDSSALIVGMVLFLPGYTMRDVLAARARRREAAAAQARATAARR